MNVPKFRAKVVRPFFFRDESPDPTSAIIDVAVGAWDE